MNILDLEYRGTFSMLNVQCKQDFSRDQYNSSLIKFVFQENYLKINQEFVDMLYLSIILSLLME